MLLKSKRDKISFQKNIKNLSVTMDDERHSCYTQFV